MNTRSWQVANRVVIAASLIAWGFALYGLITTGGGQLAAIIFFALALIQILIIRKRLNGTPAGPHDPRAPSEKFEWVPHQTIAVHLPLDPGGENRDDA